MTKRLWRDLGTAATVAALLLFSVPTAAQAQDHASLSESEMQAWTHFAEGWNRIQETEYTAEELRAALPGVSTGEVAWVLAERRFNEDALAASHWSPEQLLLETPELRLSGKMVGQVASMSLEWRDGLPDEWFGAPEPELQTPLTEERLWDRLGHLLDEDIASLRAPIIPFRDLLWLQVAQTFDRKVWHETSMTAHEMLSSPDYGLTRKLVADNTTLSILIDCFPEHGGVGPAYCTWVHDLMDEVCDAIDLACWIPKAFCAERVKICRCEADCTECTCNGGEAEGGSCLTDCLDKNNDCS